MNNTTLDTIAAIATVPGESGIGIVRISGTHALDIADTIFVSKDKKKPSLFASHSVHYGWVIDAGSGAAEERIIDEALLIVMRSPRSYTREDVVEINCHGGFSAVRNVLDAALKSGCRLSEPGEFTKRAFLNGRIDLSQAEAVLDIIQAKTDSARALGLQQLRGVVSSEINGVRKKLVDILSLLEAHIDFPEEDLGTGEMRELERKAESVKSLVGDILESYKRGRVFREGISTVICGKANVGKSSLLNALLKQERSIVTSIPGTTRDTIEEVIDIKGIPLKIVDTAGIIEPRDLVEKKAMRRTRDFIRGADLVLLMFDGSKKLTGQDEILMRNLRKKKVIAVINKSDLPQRIEKERIQRFFPRIVFLSAKKIKNIPALEQAITETVRADGSISFSSVLMSNQRHVHAMRKTYSLLSEACLLLNCTSSLELTAQDVKESLGLLDEITGKKFSEEMLDKIFSRFCIGK
ncbi:MAG: tRNA uridine-5-carboxymethylaminomethyl(34) synthesis GTPase MnmE [Candidatus Omnitrophica bacterium]|nr:tRNA uridine-5-carboxymethylaminomethyl(34) synthesis GTPase MnmE [Candidatus Omnitrophota bacterium]